MKILVFGATGSQQFHIIEEANNKGAEVIAATSSAKHFEKLKEAGATPVLANMNDLDQLYEATKGIDAIAALFLPVSLPNPLEALQYAKNIIDAAKANHVKKIVWNASSWISPIKLGIPSEDVKLDIRDYLQHSGIDYVIIEPTIYMENLSGPFSAPYIINEHKIAYPTPEQMPIGWIAARDVSAFVVEAIYNTTLRADSFQISGLENVTGNELAEQFSQGFGEKIVYFPMPPKDFGELLKPVVGDAGAAGVEAYYQSFHDASEYPSKFNPEMDKVLEKLPVKMTSIAQWAQENKAYFAGE